MHRLQQEEGARSGTTTLTGWFEELRQLGPVRVISICGPSVFETICEVPNFGIAGGHVNVITPGYHWHLEVERVHRIRTRDDVHARSGRRVLFFELFEAGVREPFLAVYLHREKGQEFEASRLSRFEALHARLGDGALLTVPVPSTEVTS